jgi:glycosyltransferase involved in cell wall biosynthesis
VTSGFRDESSLRLWMIDSVESMRALFIGINGFDLAYTRVRCYNFSRLLKSCGYDTGVFTFQEEYFPGTDPDYMLNLKDPVKINLAIKSIRKLWMERGTLLYLQKAHYHAAAPYLLSRLGRNSYILDYDDWDLDRSPFFDSRLFNRIAFGGAGTAKITANLASRAAACVVSTEPLKELMKRYNDHVYLVPTVVDTDQFKPSKKKDSKVTFVWNGMVWGKVIFDNVMFVADCFREVHDSLRSSELIIAGKGGWYGNMREEIKKRHGGLPITVREWVPPGRVPALLCETDVGLLPLIPDSENEQWMSCKCPTKLFEFMAMAMPTVSSDFGEARRIIRDGENGFLASDKKDFVEKMKLLAASEELRLRMGAKAREDAVSYYSLHAQRDALCKVVRVALRNGK